LLCDILFRWGDAENISFVFPELDFLKVAKDCTVKEGQQAGKRRGVTLEMVIFCGIQATGLSNKSI
jgi:hypothetical protein